jgi:hypothetical protein
MSQQIARLLAETGAARDAAGAIWRQRWDDFLLDRSPENKRRLSEARAVFESALNEEDVAETRAYLAAGGRLEPMQLIDLLFLKIAADAGPGWTFCEHLQRKAWGTDLTPVFWSPAKPDAMLCGECFGAIPDARPCDYCRIRPSTNWRDFAVPRHQLESNGEFEFVPEVKARVRLCDVCGRAFQASPGGSAA